MKMLAEQAEKNILTAIIDADKPNSITEDDFEDEVYDEHGESHPYTRIIYSCGSCVGYDPDEVLFEYKFLITQLTRRSAFLTMFGLFEHRISNCFELMTKLINCNQDIKGKGPIEKTQNLLKSEFGAKNIPDVDHLTVIRNIMIHNDGTAPNYRKILSKTDKKTDAEKRLLKAIKRTPELRVNNFNGLIMDEGFLQYAVSEFDRYTKSLEIVIQTYHKEMTSQDSSSSSEV